jgi:predicted RNA-binding Zn-ribbon protein involved in translation (DUF1610 family)
MKSFKEKLSETVDKIKSPDEQHFADKHIVDKKEHPHAKEDQFVAKTKKAKRQADRKEGEDEAVYEEARDIECPECGETYAKGEEHECKDMGESYKKKKSVAEVCSKNKKPMSEEEMTAAQEKKREEIVKSMKKKMGEFKDRYGDDAEKVMYATATKQAMKEEVQEELYEAVIDDLRKIVKSKSRNDVKFADGSKLKVDMYTASALVQVHDALNGANQKKFADAIHKNENMFMKMVDFAFSAAKRGK